MHGHLLSSDVLQNEWDRRDAFEGEGYARVLAPVQLADGSVVEAYLYQLNPRQGGELLE